MFIFDYERRQKYCTAVNPVKFILQNYIHMAQCKAMPIELLVHRTALICTAVALIGRLPFCVGFRPFSALKRKSVALYLHSSSTCEHFCSEDSLLREYVGVLMEIFKITTKIRILPP